MQARAWMRYVGEAAMKKIVKLSLIVLIGIMATYYYIVSMEKKTAKVDAEVVFMTSGVKAGMLRNDITNILTDNGFKPNEKSPSVKDPAHRQTFVRIAAKKTFAWVRYDALIEYDGNDRLKTARFLKSNHSDGRDTSCLILYDVPSRNVTYPASCPADVQNF